jgi:hypothetical protein
LNSTPNPTDEALVAQVAAGKREAFAPLVNRHLKRTHALAQRITGKRIEDEDIAQEAFLHVWIHAGERSKQKGPTHFPEPVWGGCLAAFPSAFAIGLSLGFGLR